MSVTSSTVGKRTFKIILLGDSSTGKTSIIDRFVNDHFQQKDNPTIGIDFLGKNITHNNISCRLQLWDTAGQQRYRSLIPSYLKDAICAIFVFDVSKPQTLKNLQSWIELFRDNRGEKTVLIACGNKIDLEKQFEQTELNTIIQKYGMKYFETSALNGTNIQAMFNNIMDQIIAMQQARRKKTDESDDLMPQPTTEPLKTSQYNEEQKVGLSAQQPKRRCC